MNKIIEIGRVWECENLDALAPICWEGFKILLDTGEIKIVDGLDNLPYEKATDEEIMDFYRSQNFLFVGDDVEIVKGRKLPIGSIKKIEKFYEYKITYKTYVTYAVFTDGTKTDVRNVKNLKSKTNEFAHKFTHGYYLSGRI